MKKLPIGVQNFEELIMEDYVYVDKTMYIYNLIQNGKFYFLSRPRRFGKSLTISTLYCLFEGKKELFRNTYIYNKWSFKQFPVIKISMLDVISDSEEELKEGILNIVMNEATKHNIDIKSKHYKYAFDELIVKLSKKGKVVILIDEYEKPILDNINNKEKAERYREILRNFYVTIKSKDEYIKFVFITGITKFTKTGVFSALNNLNDVSLNKKYAQMLGYTQEELEYYFKEHIYETARELGISKDELLENIKSYYNGFSFDGKQFVYNPFSVLKFFDERKFQNYWFESGSPSFLYEYIKEKEITYEELVKYPVSELDFSSREIEAASANIFFTQAGYLTFKRTKKIGLKEKYILDYPNLEVKNSFSKIILEANYHLKNVELMENIIYEKICKNDIKGIIEEIKKIISSIPYNLHKREESYYHSLIYTIMAASGLDVVAEELTNLGRSDLVVKYANKVYIFEIKIDKNSNEALEQIKTKKYYEKYSGREIYLIGINISSELRNIVEYKIEKI
ncbi:ATP-binding protein [Thermosipho ferrireducens]|uniref:ATP-binding protein n=1 Tax=Thermosipho ferrireducens TaxID=2571116 RepID=A0ABX7S608_9BACT|nr:ATP-binding protein [Thermosipho ferrireducens]QTA38008.1 ATP-binding protein [Thermosipho ferrireducens]